MTQPLALGALLLKSAAIVDDGSKPLFNQNGTQRINRYVLKTIILNDFGVAVYGKRFYL